MSVIPFDQREGHIWFDGRMVPWADAKIHVLSHGLHYGSSVFEGERAYGGQIFKCTEHSQRLRRSAELLDFEVPYSVPRSTPPSSWCSRRAASRTPTCARSPGAARR